MESFTDLNVDSINLAGRVLEVVSLKNVEADRLYNITRMESVKTRIGDGIVMDLDDEITVYMPAKLLRFFAENPHQLECLKGAVDLGVIDVKFNGRNNTNVTFLKK